MNKIELNREKGAPSLYYQIEKYLKDKIESGDYPKGSTFYTEKELQEKFDVSRVTVRQAMNFLANQGYVESARGIGTTVVFESIIEKQKQVVSFSQEMAEHNMIFSTTYCVIEKISLDSKLADKLEIKTGDTAYKLVRVRNTSGKPFVYSVTYLRDNHDYPLDGEKYTDSLYKLLRDGFGVRLVRGEESFEAVLSNKEVSSFLKVPENTAVLRRIRKTIDQYDRVIEFTTSYYLGNKFKYSVKL